VKKQPVCETDHSPPSIAKVKNELSYTSTPPVCLHGRNREDLTFTLRLLLEPLSMEKVEWLIKFVKYRIFVQNRNMALCEP
jgi:hypothetical protein